MSIAVLQAVATHFGVLPSDLTGRSRFQYLVCARSVAALIMRERYGMAYSAIAARLGGRDHTTAMHLVRRAADFMAADEQLAVFVAQHMNGPKLPIAVEPFVPRFEVQINPRITSPTTALKRRLDMVARLLEAA